MKMDAFRLKIEAVQTFGAVLKNDARRRNEGKRAAEALLMLTTKRQDLLDNHPLASGYDRQ